MKKNIVKILALVLVCSLLAACGAAEKDYLIDDGQHSGEISGGYTDGYPNGVDPNKTDDGSSDMLYGLKIVYTAHLSLESKDFQKSFDAIMLALNDAGGHVAEKELWGGTSSDGYYTPRNASLTLKVPAENYEAFLAAGSSFGSIMHQSESSDDITAAYIDTQSRLNSLRAQYDQLIELLGKATSVSDIITIQDRISQVVAEIEYYTQTLRTYDDLVSYCTVYVTLNEVAEYSVHTDNFGAQLLEALKDSARSVVNVLGAVVKGCVYALPYLAIALVIFLIVRRSLKASREKKARMLAEANSAYGSSELTNSTANTKKK